MTIRVFRTHKGDINKQILGSLVLRNPRTGRQSSLITFRAKDLDVDERLIPAKLQDHDGKDIDLFDDLTDDGRLEILVQCLEDGQYFGAAQADVYIRAREASFVMNFVKGYTAIWLQMVLVTSFGVMFSTFLNGAVAMLATFGTIVLGYNTDFIRRVATGELQGGGPLESAIRIPTHQNQVTPLDPGLTSEAVQTFDSMFMGIMQTVTGMIPDFGKFTNANYVAYGYDIPIDTILVQLLTGLSYLVVVSVAGYFFLKTREVAA
jgi:hypothetical protein